MGALLLGGGRALGAQTPVDFQVPAHACDCHTHVFPDPSRFPFWAGRGYTPQPASPAQMAALHRALHIERVVIVTPSVYGADNSATLFGMRARGGAARGVAVIDGKTPERDLDAMHRAGVRGIRLNLTNSAPAAQTVAASSALIRQAIQRVRPRNWHVQINTTLKVIAGIKGMVLDSPVPVVFDHFGGARAALGAGQPGFAELAELVHSGRAYVKISGAYRISQRPGYTDVTPLAQALIAANGERVVWGTDWPHPDSAMAQGKEALRPRPPLPVDDGLVFNLLPVWAPDAAVRKKILVDNPARLYGF
jgi:predicted TIM-barrel fold metal-dependent hydrolase